MANQVYGPDADKEHEPISDNSVSRNQTSPGQSSYSRGGASSGSNSYAQSAGDGPVDRDGLSNAEENGGGNNLGENQTSPDQSSYSRGGSSPGTSNKSASSGELRNGEAAGLGNIGNTSSTGGYGGDNSLYRPEGDNQGGLRGRLGRARSKAGSLRARAFKNKWIVGGAVSSGTGIIALIILVVFVIGGYKAVDFAEHVAAYQFARNTASMAENTTSINEEKIGLESIPDNTAGNKLADKLKAKYTSTTGKVSDLWSKLDKYRPNKIISNYGNANRLNFDEATTRLGRTYIKSVTIDGETVPLETKSLGNSIRNNTIPGYKFVTRDVSFSRNFAPDLIDALKADGIGPITRAKVASQIRQELNISLIAWVSGRFAGKSPVDAEVAIEQDAYNSAEQGSASSITSTGSTGATTTSTSTGSTGGGTNSSLDSTAQQANAAETAQVNDAAQVKNSILPDTNSLPSSVQTALAGLKESAFTLSGIIPAVLGFVNPFYKIAVPLCLVYDGSLQSSGPTIDAQNTQAVRSAVWLQSASSQLKDGYSANAEVDGAFDYKLGDITHTFAEERANGLTPDTSSYASTEASPTGQYSLADVGLPSPLNGIVNSLGSTCPYLTNLWVAAGVAGANIAVVAVASVFSGGGGGAGVVGSEAAAETAADTAVPSLATRVLAKVISGGSKLKDFGIQTGRTVALVGGATLIARAIVASQIGATHNTLAVGQPYDDTLDCGTNIYANDIEQRQFYGAPLTDSNLAADDASNRAQLIYKENQQSAFERYAAINNPQSLISRVGLLADGYLSRSSFASLPKLAGALLSPVRSLGSVLNPLVSHSSFAAGSITSANTYCGNVQFGFTPYEKQLIATDPTYKLLENQRYLDQSGQEGNIAARYGKCFDGSESIGTMLANGDIQRNSQGDVLLDQGLCSPKNLGTANHDVGYGPGGQGFHDLVFRWRVAQGYNNTLDQLTSEQVISASSSPGDSTGTPSSGGLPTGSAKDLATQLVQYVNNGKIKCLDSGCPDIVNTANGKSIRSGSCMVDGLQPGILALMLGLAQMGHTFILSALCSDHPGIDGPTLHNGGRAADFNTIDGVFMGPNDAPWDSAKIAAAKKLDQDAATLIPNTKQLQFGQVGAGNGHPQCHPDFSFQDAYTKAGSTYPDFCHHQHIAVET